MGQTVLQADAAGWVGGADARARLRQRWHRGGAARLAVNYDNWGGYPAARARFLRSAQELGGHTVVITGDSHNAWAYNLAQDGHAAAVEFAGHSVTSPGYEGAIAADPRIVAAALVRANPELTW